MSTVGTVIRQIDLFQCTPDPGKVWSPGFDLFLKLEGIRLKSDNEGTKDRVKFTSLV